MTFQGGAKPSDIKKRKVELECVIKEIESKKDRYIELVDLPEIKIESYKTAKETIIENIIKQDLGLKCSAWKVFGSKNFGLVGLLLILSGLIARFPVDF